MIALALMLDVAHAQTVVNHGALPTPTRLACSAWVEPTHRLYVLGGYTSFAATAAVQVIDPATGIAAPAPFSLPSPMFGHQCAAVDAVIWIATSTGEWWSLDAATGVSTRRGSLPGGAPSAMTSDGARVYALAYDTLYAWSPTTATWSTYAGPSITRYSGPALVASHGWLYALGGATTSVERTPLASPGVWTTFGSSPTTLTSTTAAPLGDYAIVHGVANYSATAQLYRYELLTGRSRALDLYLDRALLQETATVGGASAWFLGGVDAGNQLTGGVQELRPPPGPPDLDSDGATDAWDSDDDGDGLPDWADPCPSALAGPDRDGDGTCDLDDPCPLDPDDDLDRDGQCGDVDPCPADPADDSDADGSCDGVDLCEGDDRAGDADLDGVCSDTDPCPVDPGDDSDGDGTCDHVDFCQGADYTGDADGDGLCNDSDFVLLTSPIRRARPATLGVFDARPGAAVQFWVTTRGAGVGPCPAPGVCGSLDAPIRVATATADATGTAIVTLQVPAAPAGMSLWFEAVWVQGAVADTTGPLLRRLQP